MEQRREGIFQRFLDGVERLGNKLPHPVTLFAILAGLVLLLSAALQPFDIAVEHPGEKGEIVEIKNLLSRDRKSTRLNSSHVSISYAVFCLQKKNNI